jgi:hypothetical protein
METPLAGSRKAIFYNDGSEQRLLLVAFADNLQCLKLGSAGSPLGGASISAAGAFGGHEESEMITNPKPGNHPDPNDMSGTFEDGSKAEDPATIQRKLEQEEEAERLGNFA